MNKESYYEKTIKSEQIYNGKIVKLRKDTVILPDGRNAIREIVEHPGAVVILAEKNEHRIILVKQYRKAVDEILLELPAGTIEPSEKIIDCAKRELEEETGYIAKNWYEIFDFYSAPGFCSERLTFYYANGLNMAGRKTDYDEFIETMEVRREDVGQLIKKRKIRDAKSLVGILWWLNNDR